MPRGKVPKTIPSVERKLQIPAPLDAELQLLLYSEVEQRVPYGALSKLVIPLLEEFLRKYKEAKKNG